MALMELEILGELEVLFVDGEPKVQKSPPRPQVPVEVDRVLCAMVYSFCLQNKTVVQI